MRLLKFGFIVALGSGLAVILINTGIPHSRVTMVPTEEDLVALQAPMSTFTKCVVGLLFASIPTAHNPPPHPPSGLFLLPLNTNGLGLQALAKKDNCHVTLQFPQYTVSKWVCTCLRRYYSVKLFMEFHFHKDAGPLQSLKRWAGGGKLDPLRACSITKKRDKWKLPSFPAVRRAAAAHQKSVNGATLYPLEKSPGHSMLCMVPQS